MALIYPNLKVPIIPVICGQKERGVTAFKKLFDSAGSLRMQ